MESPTSIASLFSYKQHGPRFSIGRLKEYVYTSFLLGVKLMHYTLGTEVRHTLPHLTLIFIIWIGYLQVRCIYELLGVRIRSVCLTHISMTFEPTGDTVSRHGTCFWDVQP